MDNAIKEKWVDTLLEQFATGKQYKRLIQKCIDHMGAEKKLYKYYDLESSFTLPNLENSVNYYNNPVDFNDPFDCNVGISADQLIRICLPELFDHIFCEKIDPTIKKMIETLLFENEIDFDYGQGGDESIVAACITNADIADIILRANSGEKIEDREIMHALIKNPEVLTALLKRYPDVCDDGNDAFIEEQLTNVVMQSTSFMRKMLQRATVRQDDNMGMAISIMGENDDFLRKIEKIAKLLGYDVQGEQIEHFYNQLEMMVKNLHRSLGSAVGITCFSETPQNMLMWSHYANKHTGVCVEYDFSKLFSTVPNTLLLPVEYTNKRPLLPIEKAVVTIEGKLTTDQTKMREMLPDILKSLAIKSDIWSYEREWRHIVFTKDVPSRVVKLPIISRIILGINISPENREKVVEVARKKQIPVYSTHMKADKYEMVICDKPE